MVRPPGTRAWNIFFPFVIILQAQPFISRSDRHIRMTFTLVFVSLLSEVKLSTIAPYPHCDFVGNLTIFTSALSSGEPRPYHAFLPPQLSLPSPIVFLHPQLSSFPLNHAFSPPHKSFGSSQPLVWPFCSSVSLQVYVCPPQSSLLRLPCLAPHVCMRVTAQWAALPLNHAFLSPQSLCLSPQTHLCTNTLIFQSSGAHACDY